MIQSKRHAILVCNAPLTCGVIQKMFNVIRGVKFKKYYVLCIPPHLQTVHRKDLHLKQILKVSDPSFFNVPIERGFIILSDGVENCSSSKVIDGEFDKIEFNIATAYYKEKECIRIGSFHVHPNGILFPSFEDLMHWSGLDGMGCFIGGKLEGKVVVNQFALKEGVDWVDVLREHSAIYLSLSALLRTYRLIGRYIIISLSNEEISRDSSVWDFRLYEGYNTFSMNERGKRVFGKYFDIKTYLEQDKM